jgi:hypothetical protein
MDGGLHGAQTSNWINTFKSHQPKLQTFLLLNASTIGTGQKSDTTIKVTENKSPNLDKIAENEWLI